MIIDKQNTMVKIDLNADRWNLENDKENIVLDNNDGLLVSNKSLQKIKLHLFQKRTWKNNYMN